VDKEVHTLCWRIGYTCNLKKKSYFFIFLFFYVFSLFFLSIFHLLVCTSHTFALRPPLLPLPLPTEDTNDSVGHHPSVVDVHILPPYSFSSTWIPKATQLKLFACSSSRASCKWSLLPSLTSTPFPFLLLSHMKLGSFQHMILLHLHIEQTHHRRCRHWPYLFLLRCATEALPKETTFIMLLSVPISDSFLYSCFWGFELWIVKGRRRITWVVKMMMKECLYDCALVFVCCMLMGELKGWKC